MSFLKSHWGVTKSASHDATCNALSGSPNLPVVTDEDGGDGSVPSIALDSGLGACPVESGKAEAEEYVVAGGSISAPIKSEDKTGGRGAALDLAAESGDEGVDGYDAEIDDEDLDFLDELWPFGSPATQDLEAELESTAGVSNIVDQDRAFVANDQGAEGSSSLKRSHDEVDVAAESDEEIDDTGVSRDSRKRQHLEDDGDDDVILSKRNAKLELTNATSIAKVVEPHPSSFEAGHPGILEKSIAYVKDLRRAKRSHYTSRQMRDWEARQATKTDEQLLNEEDSDLEKKPARTAENTQIRTEAASLIDFIRNPNAIMEQGEFDAESLCEMVEHLRDTALPKPAKKKSLITKKTPGEPEKRLDLLRGNAEMDDPWFGTNDCPLDMVFRISDSSSQGKVRNKELGITSAKATLSGELNTVDGRKHNIELHCNFGNREHTCFVSTTGNFYDVQPRVEHHEKRSTNQDGNDQILITVINIKARARRPGTTTLNMASKITHYKADFSKNIKKISGVSFFKDEWIMLYQVHPLEIVFHWWASDIRKWLRQHGYSEDNWAPWYLKIAKPAYDEHERLSKSGASQEIIEGGVEALLKRKMRMALEKRK